MKFVDEGAMGEATGGGDGVDVYSPATKPARAVKVETHMRSRGTLRT